MSEVYAYAGGMSFHLIYDAAADAAPQTFRDAIEAAAKQLSQAIRNQITVNLKIDISGTGGSITSAAGNVPARNQSGSQHAIGRHSTCDFDGSPRRRGEARLTGVRRAAVDAAPRKTGCRTLRARIAFAPCLVAAKSLRRFWPRDAKGGATR